MLIRSLLLTAVLGSLGWLAGHQMVGPRLYARTSTSPLDRLDLSSDTSTPLVVFVVQPADCARDRSAIEAWRGAAQRLGLDVAAVIVAGAGSGPDQEAAADSLRGTLSPVPDEGRKVARFARSLGFTATPLVLGFDASERLRLATEARAVRDTAHLRSLALPTVEMAP